MLLTYRLRSGTVVMSSSGLSFLIGAVGLSMNTTYTPWVDLRKYPAIGSPRPNSRGYMIMLVIPMDPVNLHEVADLHKYLNWYSVIPDLVWLFTRGV